MTGDALSAADQAVLDRWWQTFVATGCLPSDLALVQGRLVRAVHRGALPSGEVFVKVMTFPRAKDRLRYACRALPAEHEARLLRAAAAAGVACPAVVAVRTGRRAGLPSRSLLVLRALPVAAFQGEPGERLAEAAAVAVRLLAAGIEHRDLHDGNFVRLADGTLAVLDLQSASVRGRPRTDRAARVAAAARLVRDLDRDGDERLAAALQQGGLVRAADELTDVWRRAAADRARHRWSRVRRCLGETTEFTREIGWLGVMHRQRGALPAGRWWPGNRALRRAWLGQRARHLFEGCSPPFPAFFRKWWWLGGRSALYVPDPCSEVWIDAEVRAATDAFERYRSGSAV